MLPNDQGGSHGGRIPYSWRPHSPLSRGDASPKAAASIRIPTAATKPCQSFYPVCSFRLQSYKKNTLNCPRSAYIFADNPQLLTFLNALFLIDLNFMFPVVKHMTREGGKINAPRGRGGQKILKNQKKCRNWGLNVICYMLLVTLSKLKTGACYHSRRPFP